MHNEIPEEYRVEHYPTPWERAADRWVHLIAILAAAVGASALIFIAIHRDRPGLILAAALYGLALIAMLACSAIYNLSRVSPARPMLRRLDEAGIFLMIAGSYTPFTTQTLHGAWAVGMTALVWAIAITGIVGKLILPQIPERAWTGLYILFGWVAVIAFEPLRNGLPMRAFALLVGGGLVYTGGCWIFLKRNLPFRRAVWHGFVSAGAALHFAAVVIGVVALQPVAR
jgi:hemolysin III